MKRFILGLFAAAVIALFASRADAKVIALYASGQGGVQNTGQSAPGLGFELGARVLILDAYVDYTAFSATESISRGIFGVRGGFGARDFRLVLRAGVGGIREDGGALTGPLGAPARTGGVARAGASFEGRLNKLTYLGFGLDGETYRFPDNSLGIPVEGSDIFAAMRLTFELGI